VATDYGGTYGDRPWRDVQPPYTVTPQSTDQPPGTDQPAGTDQPPGTGQVGYGSRPPGWPRRSRTSLVIAITALVLGLAGLAVSLLGMTMQMLPRQFTAAQQRQITNWEYGKLWRDQSAGAIFPASATYTPPTVLDDDPSLTLAVRRIGIVRQATCKAATDAAAAAILDRDGCAEILRATYADGSDSYVVTVGVAVLPGTAQASAAARSLAQAKDVGGIIPPACARCRLGTRPRRGSPTRGASSPATSRPVPMFSSTRPGTPTAGRKSRSPATAMPTGR
jgi:hypothetical protein